ncbi:MAG: hypothetical protein ACYDEA_12205 [Candidatus Dormibacteria bacterium]
MSTLASRWGPVISRATGWLVIVAWVAWLAWLVHIVAIYRILDWVTLSLIGWWLLPRARRLWWRYGWHWPLAPAPPPELLPPFPELLRS